MVPGGTKRVHAAVLGQGMRDREIREGYVDILGYHNIKEVA